MADITAAALKQFLDELERFTDDPKIQALAPQLKTIRDAFKLLDDGLPLTESAMEEVTKAMQKLGSKADEIVGPIRKFDNALKRSIKTFTGVTDASDTLMGSFANMAKEQKTLGGVLDQVKKSFDETLTSFNIGISVTQKLVEGSIGLALANDQATAAFNKATGAGGRYNSQIISLEKENRKFGISAADSAAAMQDLIGGLSGFGLMAAESQTALADEVSELGRLGVTGSEVVGVFQSVTKTFGMNNEAALDLTKQAETLAQELGITMNQAVSDLNKALPQLANLASHQVGPAFKRLSEQALETGLSIDQLTSMADRFMTFEGAGKAASNLNAVLGTQMFDTMSLLEAQLEGPQAFIDTFRQQLGGAIGDFDSLTVFQKQAIANAAGMSTVELRNLMNAEQLTEEQKKQAESRRENLKAAMALKDELMATMMEFTVALTPVIKGVKTLLSFFTKMLETSRKVGEMLIPFKGIGGALGTVAAAVGVAKGGSAIAKGVSNLLGFGGKKLGTKANPMYTQSVDEIPDVTSALEEVGDSIGDKLKDKLKEKVKTKFGEGTWNLPKLPKPKKGGLFSKLKGGFNKLKGIPGMSKLGRLAPLAKIGGRFVPGLNMAMLGYDAFKMGKRFLADGTDSTQRGPAIVGEEGPEMLVPPPGSAVINNTTMKKAVANGAGGGSSQAVVAAINNLGTKIDGLTARLGAPGDFVMQVNKREFGRLINEHFGKSGGAPDVGVT